jgi:lipopolysaccharide transport system permease protein
VRRIQQSRWLVPVDFRELWQSRGLVRFFVARDIKSRYRQTLLGPAWAILRPFGSIVVFTVIFGNLANIKSNTGVPYALWVTPGVLAMGYITASLTGTSTSLINNSHLITKTYFPRLYVPLSTALTPIFDLLLGLLVLLGMFAYFEWAPSWQIVFLPAFVALAMLVVLGLGLWLSAGTARYRDWVFGVPFAVSLLTYLTPVIYPPTGFIPAQFQWVLTVNPFTAVVAGFRWSMLGTPFGSLTALAFSIGIGAASTASGLYFFRRAERTMADML